MIDRPFLNADDDALGKRAEPRCAVRWRGQVHTADGRRLAVRIVDLSASGAGLVGDDKLAPHESVFLEAQVPRLPTMDSYATERWRATVMFQTFSSGALRSGLKFDDLTPELEAMLRAWIGRSGKPF